MLYFKKKSDSSDFEVLKHHEKMLADERENAELAAEDLENGS